MSKLTPREIIDMAVKREEEAATFYRKVAEMQDDAEQKDLFLMFARIEDVHKEKLLKLDISDCEKIEQKKVIDLKLGDHLREIEPQESMDRELALKIGMQREKRAYQLYTGLAESTDDAGLRNLFTRLAEEEAAHKLWFEVKFDDYMLELAKEQDEA
jgi:rubrerythrin